mgnify:CR=1 FL=1
MRISMDKRFKIGTVFNICLLAFFGFFSAYHVYSFDSSVRSSLENDIRWFLTTEKNVRECHELRQKVNELKPLRDDEVRSEASGMALALRDDSLEFIAKVGHLIASDSVLAARIASQTKAVTTSGIASAEFMIIQADLNNNMQKLATELLYVRNRSLQLLTAKKDALLLTRKAFQSRFLLTTLATSIVAFVALFFISHQIKLPTRKIMEIIRKIRDGNYSIPVRSHTGNEVDQIVAGLASVADTLKIRDQLKIDKIQLEKKRFSAFANFVNVPLLMINDEKKIAFANDECMTLFKLTWDELYEVDFAHAPLPVELRDKLTVLMSEKKWVENEQCDIIGENYAFDLHLSLIPVKSTENPVASVIITLGKIDCRKRAVPSQKV